MKATLKAFTQPTEEFLEEYTSNAKDTDWSPVLDLVAYCARVSNPSNQMNKETGEKLIRHLIKHKHWSPLEMADALIEIETTRDIARQLLRHKSMKFQEFSQRYADPTVLKNTFVVREARLQDPKNRQNSIPCDNIETNLWWDAQQKFVIHNVERIYKEALAKGIAKEQARAILPEGNTISRLYAKADIRTWIHYVELRTANGTQLEHMLLAKEIGKAISKIFPMMEDFIQI